MNKVYLLLAVLLTACGNPRDTKKEVHGEFTRDQLFDKIKGGWAGQVIGVTYGGPTEFRFNGTMINDYVPIDWYDGYISKTMRESPGLYDDLYMDLTFVDVFERHGLDAPVDVHADAYANAGYRLWHANQAGRYNILNGLRPPASGHWLNNPHADDIDFQIEADFAGLMSPGMPNTAAQIGDAIGHIMNYGDGWYGGVYISAMYALAFVSDDIQTVVKEALKTIPEQSDFYRCMADVIHWHQQYPNDWKQTWFEIQRKWSDDVGCPDGVFVPFNIDAKVNAAYVILGLLYGNGDFYRTLEISTRAGQDSDCNPSSAAGILGTMIGYNSIPDYWKQGLTEAEEIDFQYTTLSLNKTYALSFKHALEVIQRNGGKIENNKITIHVQNPQAVRFEKSFEGHYPVAKIPVNRSADNEFSESFDGIGFVIRGEVRPRNGSNWNYFGDFTFRTTITVDDNPADTVMLPASFTTRRHELFWKYAMPEGKHALKVTVLNPHPEFELRFSDILVYDTQSKSH
jgi:hypothetical protein